jgi:hypothetical protein
MWNGDLCDGMMALAVCQLYLKQSIQLLHPRQLRQKPFPSQFRKLYSNFLRNIYAVSRQYGYGSPPLTLSELAQIVSFGIAVLPTILFYFFMPPERLSITLSQIKKS